MRKPILVLVSLIVLTSFSYNAHTENKTLDDAEAYFDRGTVKYYLGKYEEAIQDFGKAVRLNPNNADA